MGIKKSKKLLLYQFVGGQCEQCKKNFPISKIQIHRINRKSSYEDFRALKVLCVKCHRLYHAGEFK